MSTAEILQGSVVTCIRCDGKFNSGLTANLLQNPTCEIILKMPKLCLIYYSIYIISANDS